MAKEDGDGIWELAEKFDTDRYGSVSKYYNVHSSNEWTSDFLFPFLTISGLSLKPVIENNTLHLIGRRAYYISDSQINSQVLSTSLEHWTMPLA